MTVEIAFVHKASVLTQTTGKLVHLHCIFDCRGLRLHDLIFFQFLIDGFFTFLITGLSCLSLYLYTCCGNFQEESRKVSCGFPVWSVESTECCIKIIIYLTTLTDLMKTWWYSDAKYTSRQEGINRWNLNFDMWQKLTCQCQRLYSKQAGVLIGDFLIEKTSYN